MSSLIGLSGHAASAGRDRAATTAAMIRSIVSPRAFSGLLALELRLALFHECAAPLDVVLALEAVEDEPPAQLHVHRLAIGLQDLADDALARLDGERRTGGDRVG